MPDINYHAVIADLEDRGNAMLEAAADLRNIMLMPAAKIVIPVVAVKKVPKSNQIRPISDAICAAINGERTAVQIADLVEPQYPDRDILSTRQNVSTQLSMWQKEGKVRKNESGHIYFVQPAPPILKVREG